MEAVNIAQALPHTDGGLAAEAFFFRGMGAEARVGQRGPEGGKEFVEPGLAGIPAGFGEVAAPDAGLIAHQKSGNAFGRKTGQRFTRAGDEFHAGGVAEVVAVVDDGAVAVEEYGVELHGVFLSGAEKAVGGAAFMPLRPMASSRRGWAAYSDSAAVRSTPAGVSGTEAPSTRRPSRAPHGRGMGVRLNWARCFRSEAAGPEPSAGQKASQSGREEKSRMRLSGQARRIMA